MHTPASASSSLSSSWTQPPTRPFPERKPPPTIVQQKTIALQKTQQQPSPTGATAFQQSSVTPMNVSPPLVSESQDTGRVLHDPVNQTLAWRHRKMKQLDKDMLKVVYGKDRVRDCELLDHMACRHLDFAADPSWLELSDQELEHHLCSVGDQLASRLVKSLPKERLKHLAAVPAIAKRVIRYHPDPFSCLPECMKTEQVLTPLLKTLPKQQRHRMLDQMAQVAPQLAIRLETIEQAIRRNASWTCARRANELTFELRCLAIKADYRTIGTFAGMHTVDDEEYSALCDLALQQSGEALAWICKERKTEAHVEQALKHRIGPGIQAIPESMHTRERLKAALPHTKQALPCSFFDRWDLWETLKTQDAWIHLLESHDRTPEIYSEYLSRFPGDRDSIPEQLGKEHPQWLVASQQPDVYLSIPHQILLSQYYDPVNNDGDACSASFGSTASGSTTDESVWAWLLAPLDEQITDLPEDVKKALLTTGDISGLGSILQAPSWRLDPGTLIDPVQEAHCSRRALSLPHQARTQLMRTRPFRLPRPLERQELINQMDHRFLDIQQQLTNGSLPLWQPEPGTSAAWQLRGGRTLMHAEQEVHIHMKLQRRGEPLHTFAAEQAVQGFAGAHSELKWRSEIPVPGGMYLVPLDKLPVAHDMFPDPLEIYNDNGRDYGLAFRFTTKDDSYDTLAWQPDASGDSRQSGQGLLHALHDLGVWSSLGAVHTSTIRLYHHFLDEGYSRPALLLTAFFRPDGDYPGSLHLWNTKATQQSDWGKSGLRDLGDLEFYPFITTYLEAVDAEWTLPDYGQRASFVNAMAQNILASLLHYMRLHRDTDPDYHYRNRQSVTRLAQFIEQGCNAFLDGLLGKGVQLKDFFAAAGKGVEDIYPEWLRLTAQEIIYWSARQEQAKNSDCFCVHLNRDGRPCAELYPGHPWQSVSYGHGPHGNYLEAEGENLGTRNGKLVLFYLVRGLYLMATGVAHQLGELQ